MQPVLMMWNDICFLDECWKLRQNYIFKWIMIHLMKMFDIFFQHTIIVYYLWLSEIKFHDFSMVLVISTFSTHLKLHIFVILQKLQFPWFLNDCGNPELSYYFYKVAVHCTAMKITCSYVKKCVISLCFVPNCIQNVTCPCLNILGSNFICYSHVW